MGSPWYLVVEVGDHGKCMGISLEIQVYRLTTHLSCSGGEQTEFGLAHMESRQTCLCLQPMWFFCFSKDEWKWPAMCLAIMIVGGMATSRALNSFHLDFGVSEKRIPNTSGYPKFDG